MADLEVEVVEKKEGTMYQNKLNEARLLLENHFTAVHTKNGVFSSSIPHIVAQVKDDVERFFTNLLAAGGTDDDALKHCTWEDLESFGAPKLLAKRVAAIFRGRTEESKSEKTNVDAKLLKPARVAAMSITELVQCYDPRESSNAVAERISKIANGKRCIVFNSDNSVNIEASVTLLNELRDGYSERENFPVAGVPTKIYKVGERIGQIVDENPLYSGRALRPNGDCDQTNRSWSGVSEIVRKIVHLARVRTGEIKIEAIMDAHGIMDFVVGADEAKVRSRLNKASLLYDELKEKGNLPSLKISLKGDNESSKKNDPFGGNHKTY